MLEYENYKSFSKNVGKAMSICASLSMSVGEHFETLKDDNYKLDRFACFLITMNSDTKKPNVARAQVYFVALTEAIATIQTE